MNDTMSRSNPVAGFFKKALAFAGLSSMVLGGGALGASAGGSPAFNTLTDDYSTLQVASNGGTWGSSVVGSAGDTVSLLVWDHNTNPDAVANNVTIKVSLPTAMETNHAITASVSADNAAAANGSIAINGTTATNVSYVAGSAKFYRNVNGALTAVNFPTNVNADDIVKGGINLGQQGGCWQYAQAVIIQVKLTGGNAAIHTEKTVELVGGKNVFGSTATAQPGDEVAFKIYVENTGNAVGAATRIIDTLDSHLTYEAGSTIVYAKENNKDVQYNIDESKINKNGQTITWAWFDMEARPDTAIYLLFKAKVAGKDSFPVGGTTLQNCAKATFTGISADTNCVSVIVNRAVDTFVDFTLRKEVSRDGNMWYDDQLTSAAPGDKISYRITLQNTGNTAAQNVTLKDILPAGVSYAGNAKIYSGTDPKAVGTAINADSLFTSGYNLASVANGTAGLVTITFDANLTNVCSGQQTLTNKAQVIYQSVVRKEDTATVIFSCTKGLIITKDVQDPKDNQFKDQIGAVTEGKVLTYRIVVANNGNTTVTNPVVTDNLPKYVTYVNNSLTIDGQYMSATVQDGFLNQGMVLTDLTPGMSKQIIFQVRVVDCPDLGDTVITNTAYAKADGVAQISDTAKATVHVNKPDLKPVF